MRARASDRGQARPGSADSDGLERAGDALNKEVTSHTKMYLAILDKAHTKMYLANRPYIRDTHTVDAKASPDPGRGRVVPCGGKGPHRQQGNRSPETADGEPTRRQGRT